MIDYRAPLDELPDPLPITPLQKPFDVTIRPPGSKSITNRAYMLAALAEGESKIIRPLRSEDTDALLDALCTLGAEARWAPGKDGDDVFIKGVAGRFPRGGSVNLGDGGTPTRFMIAAACLAAEPVVVDGSPRMRERPIAEGVDMLRRLGAKIEYVEEEGRLPVRVVPSEDFKGGELTIGRTASSQFISALMLIGPWLKHGVEFCFCDPPTSRDYIFMTVAVMDCWKARPHIVFKRGGTIWKVLIEHDGVNAHTVETEADASSAAYWYVGAALIRKSRVMITGLSLDSVQPDMRVPAILTEVVGLYDDLGQNFYTLQSTKQRVKHLAFDASDFPDGAMVLAVAASEAAKPSTITGLHTLRVKETDRIAALANELRKVGCTVETTDDSITITPPSPEERAAEKTEPIVIETYNDHRMAMSFAILGLVRPGIAIANPKCVAKSYPAFWRDFAKLYE